MNCNMNRNMNCNIKERVFFTIIALFVVSQAFSYDFIVNGIAYNYDTSDQTAIVTMADEKYEGDIVIPNYVTYKGRTMKVKAIGESAFYYCDNLQNVTLPETITYIDYNAFAGSGIKSIKLPESLKTIGSWAFCNSELQEVDFPNSLERIGSMSFSETKIKRLIVDGTKHPNGLVSLGTIKGVPLEYIYLNGVESSRIESTQNIKRVVLGPGTIKFLGANSEFDYPTIKGKIDELIIEDSENPIDCEFFPTPRGGLCLNAKNVYWGRQFDYYNNHDGDWAKYTGGDSFYAPFLMGKRLKELTIGKFVTDTYMNAYSGTFKDCDSLELIRVNIGEPDKRGTLFSNTVYINATLYVPIGSKEKYQNAEGWKNFWNIEEWDFVNDIKPICDESKREQCVYNLQGQKQIEKQKGFNIVRYSDGRTRKVFVK